MKKVSAVLIALILSLSLLSGCNTNKETADDTLSDFADMVCDYVVKGDYKKIEDCSYLKKISSREFNDTLDYYYDNPAWDSVDREISEQILSTLTFDIDENSIMGSYENEEGEFDVTFEHVDYMSLYKSKASSDKKDFLNRLKDYDKVASSKVHVECVYMDDLWYLEDFEKVLIDVIDWNDQHFDFVRNYNDYIEDYYWNHNDNSRAAEYDDTTEIQLMIEFNDSNVDWSNELYYELIYDGEVIYHADIFESSSFLGIYWCGYSSYWFTDGGPLPSGTYRIVVYDFEENVIIDESCSVNE